MLQYSTVEPGTLDLLKQLMQMPELRDFYLVGGTALALYYGHRKSIDIDLFATVDFQAEALIPALEKQFTRFTYNNAHNPVGLFAFINNIKADFVKHHYFPLIDSPVIEDGIRLVSINDIIAMKIAAILKRGVKKDFWDISELLDHYSIEHFIDCYNRKYPNQQLLISIPQALIYFADAEESEDPVSLKAQTWAKVKKHIQSKVNNFLR
ncbi:MAG: nucleotidyl transferase AbiEii/AbiGii toxin family protein [Chitinophagales bacterium]